MSRVRARLLVSLVLVAVMLAAFGVGSSVAASRGSRTSHSRGDLVRPRATPTSGEPDGGGHNITGYPITHPNSMCPMPGSGTWWATLWYQLLVERHQKEAGRH